MTTKAQKTQKIGLPSGFKRAVPLADGSFLAVGSGMYNGKFYLNIRKCFLPEGKSELQPTKKGVNLPLECSQALLEMIQSTIEDGVEITFIGG